MGKTSVCSERLSLIWKGLGAIAFLTVASLPTQAATPPPLSAPNSIRDAVSSPMLSPTHKSTSKDNTAEDLRPTPAQVGDPPELPVLEPSYIFLDQPVSVPPIAPPVAPEPPTASSPTPSISTPTVSTPTVSVPPLRPVVTSPPAEVIEPVEAAETVVPMEIAPSEIAPSEIAPPDTVETAEETEPSEVVEVVEARSDSEIPLAPPFLGDLTEQTESATAPQTETLASDSTRSSSPTALPTVSPAALPMVTEPGSSQTIPPVNIRPNNVSRWPEPIPFGRPLPNN